MTERRKKHIGLWIFGILFLVVAVHFFVTAFSVSAELPAILEYKRSRLSDGITFSTYEKLPNTSYSEKLSICSELDPVTIDGIGEVRPVLVNENYFTVYHIYVAGSPITAEHIDKKLPAVVISDRAARRLSLNADVVGQTISLYGRDFTVTGVYNKPSGFLRENSSDIYDRVYLPYNCYDGYADISVDTVSAPKGAYSEKTMPLLGMTETDTGFYMENDLSIKRDILINLPNLLISVIAVILTIIAIRLITKLIVQTRRKLQNDSQKDYYPTVIKRNIGYILLRILAVILLIAVPAAFFIFFPPRLVLPQSYIPYDNIFEISHYLDAFKTTLQTVHTNLWCGSTYLSELFWISFTVCTAELIVLSAASCYYSVKIYQAVKRRKQQSLSAQSQRMI